METSIEEQTFVENTNKSNLNYKEDTFTTIHEVEDTPFKVVETEKGNFVVLGNHRLTHEIETKEEAIKEAKKMTWERIMQVIHILVENHEDFKKHLETIKE